MDPLWAVPAVTLVVGGLVVAHLVRQAAHAARELADEVVRVGEVRPVLARLQGDASRARASVRRHRRR